LPFYSQNAPIKKQKNKKKKKKKRKMLGGLGVVRPPPWPKGVAEPTLVKKKKKKKWMADPPYRGWLATPRPAPRRWFGHPLGPNGHPVLLLLLLILKI
jgi:hypothetical protein